MLNWNMKSEWLQLMQATSGLTVASKAVFAVSSASVSSSNMGWQDGESCRFSCMMQWSRRIGRCKVHARGKIAKHCLSGQLRLAVFSLAFNL